MANYGVYSPSPPGQDMPGVISSSRFNFEEVFRLLNQFGGDINNIQRDLGKITPEHILYWIGHYSNVNKRITNTDSPYTVQSSDVWIMADTDAAAITINMPAGTSGRFLGIINVGNSGYNVTLVPSGTNLIFGANANYTLYSTDSAEVIYNATEGWRGGPQQRVNYDGTGAVSIGPNAKTGLDYSTIIGENAAKGATATITAAGYNSAGAGGAGCSGVWNTVYGGEAGKALTSGYANFLGGFSAGLRLTIGYNNCFIGPYAGQNMIGGTNSFALGFNALGVGQSCVGDVAIGTLALYNQVGSGVVGIGYNVANQGVDCTWSVFIGYNTAAGSAPFNCYRSVIIGDNAAENIATGSDDDTIVGYKSFYNLQGDGNVSLGSYSGYYETGSNKLFIDNAQRASEADARVKALLYGVFDAATANQKLSINAECYVLEKLGVGTTGPAVKFAVFGSGAQVAEFTRDLPTDATVWLGGDNNGPIIKYSDGANSKGLQFANSSDAVSAVISPTGTVGIGTTSPSANAGLTIENGKLCLKETTTPTADTDYGKIYTKSDNKLYFQDGSGTEHEIAFV